MSGDLNLNRRSLFKGGALASAALATPLTALMARQAAAAETANGEQLDLATSPYGPIAPAKDLTTNLYLLQLPRGFSYRSISWTGDRMSDGQRVPPRHDGMAVVSTAVINGVTELRLIRNHENSGGELFHVTGNPNATYDRVNSGGGCTALRIRNGILVLDYAAISGTWTNCAGGKTQWGTWLTCEETTYDGTSAGGKKHGYVFEVSPNKALTVAQPIVGMGRMSHEAAARDPRTGYIYLTEDARNVSAFYRYKPNNTSKVYGALAQGGTLQAAKVRHRNNADFLALGGLNEVQQVGQEFDIEWIDVPNPDADPVQFSDTNGDDPTPQSASGPYAQARAAGALRMSRGEGIWYDPEARIFYFTDTSFGYDDQGRAGRGLGAVWSYRASENYPERGRMKLIYAPAARVVGNNPDNITVSPRNGVLYCEDGDNVVDQYGTGQRLMGLTSAGEAYIFAKNNLQLGVSELTAIGKTGQFDPGDYRDSEWAGATFDPSGRYLIVNMQSPGVTFIISGPWGRGNL